VMKKENGRNGEANQNKKNGTFDYGVMQINRAPQYTVSNPP
jgi:hypothetical protein